MAHEPQKAPAPTASRSPTTSGPAPASPLRGQTLAQQQSALSPRGRTPTASAAPASTIDETMDAATQGQLDLQAMSLGFSMPAGRTLSSSWTDTVSTRGGSRVTITVTRQGLRVSMNPSVHVDAIWPVQNMLIDGCGWDFRTGQPWTDVRLASGLGEGFVDRRGDASASLIELLQGTVGRSPMSRPGYSPTADRDVMAHVSAVMDRFNQLPPSPGATPGAMPLQDPSLGAELVMRRDFNHQAGSAGLSAPAGGRFSVQIHAGGDLATLAANPGSARVQSLDINTDALTLSSGGKPVARLRNIAVLPGGRVELRDFELLGSAATGSGVESLIRLLAIGASVASHGVPGEAALGIAAQSPGAQATIVPGLTRAMIENGMSEAVQGLIRSNRNAVPGMDLGTVFAVQ